MKNCPHCGSQILSAPRDITALIDQLDLPNAERIIARALLGAWPRRSSIDHLVASLWNVSREPERPEQTLHSHVSKLRSKLRGHGWTISCRRHQGYLLEAFS